MPTSALAQPAILPPITFRLPKPGESDPHFGFSRSFYYAGEARGYWKLIRARDKGKQTGVTLVPYQSVAAFVRGLIAEQSGEAKTNGKPNRHDDETAT
jgi:hypothetical protein